VIFGQGSYWLRTSWHTLLCLASPYLDTSNQTPSLFIVSLERLFPALPLQWCSRGLRLLCWATPYPSADSGLAPKQDRLPPSLRPFYVRASTPSCGGSTTHHFTDLQFVWRAGLVLPTCETLTIDVRKPQTWHQPQTRPRFNNTSVCEWF
jgi:hypothetical protein